MSERVGRNVGICLSSGCHRLANFDVDILFVMDGSGELGNMERSRELKTNTLNFFKIHMVLSLTNNLLHSPLSRGQCLYRYAVLRRGYLIVFSRWTIKLSIREDAFGLFGCF